MKSFFFVTFMLMSVIFASSEIKYSLCTHPGIFYLSQINIIPNPPKTGENLDVQIYGNLTENIIGGKIRIDAKYELAGIWVSIPEEFLEFDLCSVTVCPILKGPIFINHHEHITKKVPQGKYKGKLMAKDQNDNILSCIDWEVPIN